MAKIQVGHDSEVFAEVKGVGMFPMIGHVGGTKHHPLPVPGGVLSEDNVSIEMAIDPTSDIDEFVERTEQVKQEMEHKIVQAGASMVIEPSVTFSEQVLDSFAPQSKEQGCDPDYNIYTLKENQYPPIEESSVRHGSGHLHVDCERAVEEPKIMSLLVMWHDVLVKAPQWLLEGNVARNSVQGNLGNYRPKVYGTEYRSSSNIILSDDRILRHAFTESVKASKRATMGKRIQASHMQRMLQAMQKNDKDKVLEYMNHYNAQEIAL